MKFNDLTGQKFGRWVVVSRAENDRYGSARWNVVCDCGNERVVKGSRLRSGKSKGCAICSKEIDLTGQRFGRLLVVSRAGHNKHRITWNVVCDCGNKKVAASSSLRSGHTRSCGCLRSDTSSETCKERQGELHPNWNPDLTDEDRERSRIYPEYIEWRNATFERDSNTCQKCGKVGGRNLNAHHIEGFAKKPELRTELSNAITLCENCHKNLHHLYGNDVGRENLETWIREREL